MLRNKLGQSTAEYAILIGIVIAAIVAIQPYVKRTLQGKYKVETNKYTNAVGAQVNTMVAGLGDIGNTSTDPVVMRQQFEYNQAVSRNTTNVLEGSGTTATVSAGGTEERVSTNNTSQATNDYRGYTYKDNTPVQQ